MPRTTISRKDNTVSPPVADSSAPQLLHPCIRVYGKCNFGKKCRFAALPANCCVSFLKASSCTSKSCKFAHISVDGTIHKHNKQRDAKNNNKVEGEEDNNNNNNNCEVLEVCDLARMNEQDNQQVKNGNDDEIKSVDEQGEKKNRAAQELLTKLKKAWSSLSQENRKLKKRAVASAEGVKGQYEHRITAEREAKLKLQSDVDAVNYKLAMQEEINRALQKEIPALLLAKMSLNNNNNKNKDDDENNNNCKTFDLEEEVSALRARVELQVLGARKMLLLSKAFDVAAAKFKEQSVGRNAFSELIRNECLFSTVSSVGEQFFKACPPQVLAQHLFKKEDGSFNSDRFEITFHGTRGSVPAALSIQCEGFDPNRRSGQGLGPGEYSATLLATAMGYSSDAVLAVLVYKPDGVPPTYPPELHNSYCPPGGCTTNFGPVYVHGTVLVIDNPKDKSCTYMLPLGCAYRRDLVSPSNKVATLTRSCECAVKHATRVVEEYMSSNNNNNKYAAPLTSSEFNGKRLYYKLENVEGEEYKQMDHAATRYLLEVLYEKSTGKAVDKVEELFVVVGGEKMACCVDLKKLKMREIKTGKMFELAVW